MLASPVVVVVVVVVNDRGMHCSPCCPFAMFHHSFIDRMHTCVALLDTRRTNMGKCLPLHTPRILLEPHRQNWPGLRHELLLS